MFLPSREQFGVNGLMRGQEHEDLVSWLPSFDRVVLNLFHTCLDEPDEPLLLGIAAGPPTIPSGILLACSSMCSIILLINFMFRSTYLKLGGPTARERIAKNIHNIKSHNTKLERSVEMLVESGHLYRI